MASTTIPRDARLFRNRQIIESEVDGEILALDVDGGECYGFNSVASSVWRLLENEMSMAEICGALVSEYDVDPETCEAEVGRLLEDLRAAGLVGVRDA